MIGHELAVEQAEAADLQPRHQPGQSDLRGVARVREHALAEEGAAEADAVEAADQRLTLPHFDRMGVAAGMELGIALLDLGVDPGVVARGAGADHLSEGPVARHGEAIGAQRLPERARQMKAVERDDRALGRLDPVDVRRVAAVRHREDADRIGAEQEIGIERHRASPLPVPAARSRFGAGQPFLDAAPQASDRGALPGRDQRRARSGRMPTSFRGSLVIGTTGKPGSFAAARWSTARPC